ncbi:MAG: OPT family oligopeptide transporter [Planctomycetota bacterium]
MVIDGGLSDEDRPAAESFNQQQREAIARQTDSPCTPPWGLFVVEFAVVDDDLTDEEKAAAEAFNAVQRERIAAEADAIGTWAGEVFLIEFAALDGLDDAQRAGAEAFNAAQRLEIDEEESAFWVPAFETFLVEFAVVSELDEARRAEAEAFNAAQMERLGEEETALWRPDGETFRVEFLAVSPGLDEDARLAAESFNAEQAAFIDRQMSSYWEPEWDEFLLEETVKSNRLTAAEKRDADEHNVMVRNTLGHEVEAAEWANRIWSKRTRFIGVGAMVIGGLWALLRLWKSLLRGIASGLGAYRALHGTEKTLKRTDRDTPMQWVGFAIVLSAIPLFFVFNHVTGDVGTSAFMAVAMLIAGFLFSAVASYMAGLVGSSNNPISGVTIATLLTSALLLLALGTDSATGPAAAILIGAVVCCAAAIGGDNMQDLKAGRILGATPYKQQIMQAVGVLAAALVMAPVLSALLRAYGIGEITVPGQEPLEAPQASLMQSVAVGVFEMNLPWTLVWTGMVPHARARRGRGHLSAAGAVGADPVRRSHLAGRAPLPRPAVEPGRGQGHRRTERPAAGGRADHGRGDARHPAGDSPGHLGGREQDRRDVRRLDRPGGPVVVARIDPAGVCPGGALPCCPRPAQPGSVRRISRVPCLGPVRRRRRGRCHALVPSAAGGEVGAMLWCRPPQADGQSMPRVSSGPHALPAPDGAGPKHGTAAPDGAGPKHGTAAPDGAGPKHGTSRSTPGGSVRQNLIRDEAQRDEADALRAG